MQSNDLNSALSMVCDRDNTERALAQSAEKSGKEQDMSSRMYASISEIYIDPTNNARLLDTAAYSEESIQRQANAIKACGGLLHPLTVTALHRSEATQFKRFMLQSGYRRMRALEYLATETGDDRWITRIPVELANSTTHGAFQLAQLIENTAREDLTPVEIAFQVEAIRAEHREEISDEDMADYVGVSLPTFKRYMSILKLPKELQDKVHTGDLSLSNAALLVSDEYDLDEQDMKRLTPLALKYSSEAFFALMDSKFGEKDESDGSSNKAAKAAKARVPWNVVENTYKPFLKAQLATLSKQEDAPKIYTEADILKARADMLDTLLGAQDTEFSKEVTPFAEAQKAEEEAKKQHGTAAKKRAAWIKKQAAEVRRLINLPEDQNGNRPYPSRTDALQKVFNVMKSMTQDKVEELGFEIDLTDEDSLKKILTEIHEVYVEQWKAAKKRRAEQKAKKAKAAAEKAAAEKAAAAGAK